MTGLYVASNPTSLTAQFSLTRNMSALSDTLTRLSTGLRINSGKDDPAGLIASELLKADITGTTKAITNTQRANSMIATADSAMGQIGNLLNDIKGLVVEAANEGAMSSDQIAANQVQINASVDAIDRIAKSTTYAGRKLLDGSMDFSTNQCGTGGAYGTLEASNVSISSANFGTADKITVDVDVQQAARRGTLIYNGTGVDQKTTINVTGSTGTETFTFGANTSNAKIVEAINAAKDSTGVQARLEGAASRGTIELNGVGANNSIVITANEEGYDNGNYTFRIVKGEKSDAYVVSEPTSGGPGIIEISLEEAYETTYTNFANLFDITIGTGNESAATAVSITRGTVNQAYLTDSDTNANAISSDGKKTLNITSAGTNGALSSVNGWTFKMVESNDDGSDVKYDDNAKVAYVVRGADNTTATTNTQAAVARISGGTFAAGDTPVAFTGTVEIGDSFTLSGGASKGELVVTYKEGATINDILKTMNANSGVQASLAKGVDGTKIMPNIIDGVSRETRDVSAASQFNSNVNATDVVELINRKLGDRFTAALATGSSGSGKMTYMDAAVDSGSVNLDNAIRFSGMDHGPIIRMTTTDANGGAIKNQKLSVTLLNPTEADRKNGITTPILQINLATDASGNSITTANDIVNLFNSLTAEQTGGISASLILPDGVDPNGRTWVTDECGNVTEVTDCNATHGKGIVQPTGVPGTCEVQENDLVLLGVNQALVKDNAVAYVRNSAPAQVKEIAVPARDAVDAVAATGSGSVTAGTSAEILTFLATSGANSANAANWNNLSIAFVENTGSGDSSVTAAWNGNVLEVSLGDSYGQLEADILAAINGQLGAAPGGVTLDALSFVQADGSPSAGNGTADASWAGKTISMGGGENYQAAVPASTMLIGAQAPTSTLTDSLGNASTVSLYDDAGEVNSSLLNGISFKFVDGTAAGITATNETWSYENGVITINLAAASSSTDIEAAMADAVAANQAAIQLYNGSNETRTFVVGPPADDTEISFDFGNNALDAAVTGASLAGTTFKMNNGRGLGDVIESASSTGTVAIGAGSIKLTTDKQTSALNGISVNFTTDSSQAGFDSSSGALTVFLNPTTQAMQAGDELNHEINQAINGAINSNWDTIKQYTDSLDTKVPSVTAELGAGTTVAELLSLTPTTNATLLKFPPSDGVLAGAPADAVRGVNVNDPALLITAKQQGAEMAGVDIKFVQDSTMQASTTDTAYVRTVYDPDTKTLLIYANDSALRNGTDGGINASVLATALNNEVGGAFRTHFTAEAPVWNTDPTSAESYAVVSFGNGILSDTQTVGGWAIQTSENVNNDTDRHYATSTGLAMTGNNDSNERIVLEATEVGSEHFVKVDVKQGSFDTYCPLGLQMCELAGTDVVATINGIQATGRGNNISIDTSTLAVSMNVTEGVTGSTSFDITGGGALFQLGPNVVSSQQMRLGLGSMLSTSLGGTAGMLYQLKNGGEADIRSGEHARVLADRIVNDAINFVSTTRGRLGAIQRSSLEPNIAMLQDSLTALTEAEASYSNADFAEESSNLTRLQLLVQSGMTTLGIANQFPQYAAQLVRG